MDFGSKNIIKTYSTSIDEQKGMLLTALADGFLLQSINIIDNLLDSSDISAAVYNSDLTYGVDYKKKEITFYSMTHDLNYWMVLAVVADANNEKYDPYPCLYMSRKFYYSEGSFDAASQLMLTDHSLKVNCSWAASFKVQVKSGLASILRRNQEKA